MRIRTHVPASALALRMTITRVLTGIKPTGTPHLGNYVGAIRPAIEASRRADFESYFFLADYHALVGSPDAQRVHQSTLEVAASWLALGLDPRAVHFYRQSDIPEVTELTWLLSCVTAKGQLNRAHAYKAAVDQNSAAQLDPDHGIGIGLYLYPVLMAADILLFNAHQVPVGRDQVQHIEIARDLAQRFNHVYGGEFFTLPQASVDEQSALLPGTDGRKMSKSYDNAIPLFSDAAALRQAIFSIVTNSLSPGEPKSADDSSLFLLYQAFASKEETAGLRQEFSQGIAWGEAKKRVFERIDVQVAPAREQYRALMAKPQQIEELLQAGAERLRPQAQDFLGRLREAVGLRSLDRLRPTEPLPARSKKPRLPRFVQFKNDAGRLNFKLIAADGDNLLTGPGFENAAACARAIAALRIIDERRLTRNGEQILCDLVEIGRLDLAQPAYEGLLAALRELADAQ